MKSIRSRVADAWCHVMHPAPMWPVNGYYQCPVCLRSYPVPWEQHSCSGSEPDTGNALNQDRTETAVAALASR